MDDHTTRVAYDRPRAVTVELPEDASAVLARWEGGE
jgi:hypothetical protein